jgi:cytoskeleton protein RodZ
LVIACAARTWVEVVDALGRVLLSRNLDAGETLGLDGQPPLQVVVGNAAATQVTYKGAGIDLQPRARDNVARFELK